MRRLVLIAALVGSAAGCGSWKRVGSDEQPKPTETLTRLLRQILDDPAAHSVWRERARARTRERYGWENVVDRYEAILEGGSAIP